MITLTGYGNCKYDPINNVILYGFYGDRVIKPKDGIFTIKVKGKPHKLSKEYIEAISRKRKSDSRETKTLKTNITKEIREKVLMMLIQGDAVAKISAKTGVSRNAVNDIKKDAKI